MFLERVPCGKWTSAGNPFVLGAMLTIFVAVWIFALVGRVPTTSPRLIQKKIWRLPWFWKETMATALMQLTVIDSVVCWMLIDYGRPVWKSG